VVSVSKKLEEIAISTGRHLTYGAGSCQVFSILGDFLKGGGKCWFFVDVYAKAKQFSEPGCGFLFKT